MPFVSKLSPEEWAQARRLRAEGATYAEIASRFGVTAETIGSRARKERWAAEDEAPSRNSGLPAVASRKPSPGTIDTRVRLSQRLFKIIEIRMKKLEISMQKRLQAIEQDPNSIALPAITQDERDAFAALIQDINQVTEMASEPASAADGRRKSIVRPELTALSDDIDAAALDAASEADEQRADLARQLAKAVGTP